MKFNYIVNPKSGKNISIYSKTGKKVLGNYVKYLQAYNNKKSIKKNKKRKSKKKSKRKSIKKSKRKNKKKNIIKNKKIQKGYGVMDMMDLDNLVVSVGLELEFLNVVMIRNLLGNGAWICPKGDKNQFEGDELFIKKFYKSKFNTKEFNFRVKFMNDLYVTYPNSITEKVYDHAIKNKGKQFAGVMRTQRTKNNRKHPYQLRRSSRLNPNATDDTSHSPIWKLTSNATDDTSHSPLWKWTSNITDHAGAGARSDDGNSIYSDDLTRMEVDILCENTKGLSLPLMIAMMRDSIEDYFRNLNLVTVGNNTSGDMLQAGEQVQIGKDGKASPTALSGLYLSKITNKGKIDEEDIGIIWDNESFESGVQTTIGVNINNVPEVIKLVVNKSKYIDISDDNRDYKKELFNILEEMEDNIEVHKLTDNNEEAFKTILTMIHVLLYEHILGFKRIKEFWILNSMGVEDLKLKKKIENLDFLLYVKWLQNGNPTDEYEFEVKFYKDFLKDTKYSHISLRQTPFEIINKYPNLKKHIMKIKLNEKMLNIIKTIINKNKIVNEDSESQLIYKSFINLCITSHNVLSQITNKSSNSKLSDFITDGDKYYESNYTDTFNFNKTDKLVFIELRGGIMGSDLHEGMKPEEYDSWMHFITSAEKDETSSMIVDDKEEEFAILSDSSKVQNIGLNTTSVDNPFEDEGSEGSAEILYDKSNKSSGCTIQ
jgi:hypothetical protein